MLQVRMIRTTRDTNKSLSWVSKPIDFKQFGDWAIITGGTGEYFIGQGYLTVSN